ncbi:MAG: signal peptidase I [Kiritimatiellae bacterium]|nr:signal peptidase I [Kiritimatiellia bacterium]
MNFFERRRTKKALLHLIKEARHVRNLREDVAEATTLERLDDGVQRVRDVLKAGNWPQAEPAARELSTRIEALIPKRSWAWLRENLEILVVALAVAMAFRTYFVQPFKIPTSSMSPTLYGIHYEPRANSGVMDYMPLKTAKWLLTGEWYVEVHATTSGKAYWASIGDTRGVIIGEQYHKIYDSANPYGSLAECVTNGEYVIIGQKLASGMHMAGDHIFVNKVGWNFHKPRRGEIMVFKTTGIEHPQIKQNEHYVKRMVGLPGEILSIETPNLYINGTIMAHPSSIARIEARESGYDGYQKTGTYLASHNNRVPLAGDQFFACGDNQRNSLDSRYWGPVKRVNLVGPAFFVYWPFSRRWGLAD